MPRVNQRDFNAAYCKRLKEAREAAGKTQAQVAKELDIPESRYAKYENRSPLKPCYIPAVCAYLKINAWWLLTARFVQEHLLDEPPPSPPRLKSVPRRA